MPLNKHIKELNILKENGVRLQIPHKTVIICIIVFFTLFFILTSLSTQYILIVTVPIGAYVLYYYRWFYGVWRSFGYSRLIFIFILVGSIALGLTVGQELRKLLWNAISDFIVLIIALK